MKVLILRPQPGADESAARARALGLDPVVAPLFSLRPRSWEPPGPGATLEWRGRPTVEALLTLRRWGRLEGASTPS